LTVYDLNLNNISSTYGGIAASSSSFLAERVKITGRVERVNGGGLIGSVNNGRISYCSFDGDVHEDTPDNLSDTTGGLIGSINGGIVTYSYSAGVSGAYSNNSAIAGGFVGRASNTTFITNYSLTDVYSTGSNFADAGGFAGHLDNSTVVNAYAYGNIYSAVRNRTGSIFSRSGGFVGEVTGKSSLRNTAAFGESMRASHFDDYSAGYGFASPFAAESVSGTVFNNIYSNHSAVLTADDTTTGIKGANIGIAPDFYDDLKMNFGTVWRIPEGYEMRTYPVFQWEREHIYRVIGEEW
jgi:hypothetical protein